VRLGSTSRCLLVGAALGACANWSVAAGATANPAPPGRLPGVSDGATPIPFASPRAAAVEVPSAPGAWGGPRTGSEATLSDRVVAYRIDATLDPVKHTVTGKESLTWRNRSDQEVRSVYLHMYMNAFEGNGSTMYTEKSAPGFEFRSDVSIKDGQWGHIELQSSTQGGKPTPTAYVHPDGGPATDHTVLRVDLPTPVAPGGSTTLEFTFLEQLPRVVARTGYFGTFHLVGQWFPKIGVLELPGERGASAVRWNVHEFHLNSEFYADFGTFDVHLSVPQGMTVGATGEEVEPAIQKDGLVTHHFVQGDVHDFAWTADSRSAPPLEATYHGAGSPEVKVKVIFPPEYANDAPTVLKATTDALAYFSETLGPYPYKTVTAVIPPYNAEEAGGMEYPTFFTAESYKDVKPGSVEQVALDFVTIHEFGHGYFYGLLASNEFEEPVLDEGMNDYWDYRMFRARGEVMSFPEPLRRLGLSMSLNGFVFEHLAAELYGPVDPVGANSWDRLSSNSYGTTYTRTATTMHDLEERIGHEALERAMKAYYERWKYRHPSVADLRETLAEVSGQRAAVERAFDLEVYHATKIDDAVSRLDVSEVRPEPGTRLVEGKWVESTVEDVDKDIEATRKAWHEAHKDDTLHGPYPFRSTVTVRRYGAAVPETLVVRFADGSSETVEWSDPGNWQRFSWVKPSRAVSAELDPDRHNLLDANRVNNSLTPSADEAGPTVRGGFLHRLAVRVFGEPASRRWSSEVAALVQSFMTLVTTL
jgi:hypothetical protein